MYSRTGIRLAGAVVVVVSVLASGGGASKAADDDGQRIAEENCASCHALSQPADGTLKARIEWRGPPLHYAADKYRRGWLVGWLQQPTRLWPAGLFPANHVKSSPKGDVIDTSTLSPHLALPADQASVVTDYLMTLTSKAELLAEVSYAPKSVSLKMGMLNFGKFKGCASCHSDEEGYGGASGPELYTAYLRLKPEFIVSYIGGPQKWVPKSLMPDQHLKGAAINKLVDYLKLISERTP